MNKADPEVKMVRLDDLRNEVNKHLYKMSIENFFPKYGWPIFNKESKDWCNERVDISADGLAAIQEIHGKLTEMQMKLFEDLSPPVEKKRRQV